MSSVSSICSTGRVHARAGRLPDNEKARGRTGLQHRRRTERQMPLACATSADGREQDVERPIPLYRHGT